MKYIRTKDGRIIDLQRLIEKEKENPYYTDYEFEEIKNEEDYCYIQWTAIGTKENSQKDQIGMRCQFGASIDSPFIKQADTIEELVDEFVWVKGDIHHCTRYSNYQELKELTLQRKGLLLFGAIWTEKGLIYVTKMNDKGELELL